MKKKSYPTETDLPCRNCRGPIRTGKPLWVNADVCSKKCYEALYEPTLTCFLCDKKVSQNEINTHHCVPIESFGLRYNEGKIRVSLIPFEVILTLAKHYTIGAKKYEDHNWRKGLSYSETVDSMMRHFIAWQLGEKTDEETGAHHLDAAIWNLVALRYFEMYPEQYAKFDDRYTRRTDDKNTG